MLALAAISAAAGPPPARVPDPEQLRFFETSIRPLLLAECGQCHGAEQQRSGLRLDTLAALLKGGSRGPSLVPGQPDRSLLLQAVLHRKGVPKMPPGRQLSGRQVADLTRWIQEGAPWPSAGVPSSGFRVPGPQNVERGTRNAERAKPHWSFQPVRRPAIPAVKDRAWVKTPVDAFILAELEKRGLRPSPPADPRALIRRVTFDLTGLPPTPQEVDTFLQECAEEDQARGLRPASERRNPRSDRSTPTHPHTHTPTPSRETAYERLVDRLLASPAYGERWGRHWLDVARYADSNGLDENVHYGNAWRYRDYVVRAFNQDKPYNEFLLEQIAGDLLPSGSPSSFIPHPSEDRLIATGFLAVGPKFISEVDSQKVLMDMVDEQVDTLGRSVMGLTLGCARCHDHKFDPISTKDYYALAGIFKSTKTLDVMAKPRMWFEHSLATEEDLARKAAHEKRVADQKTRIAALVAAGKEKLQAAGVMPPKNVETAFPEEARAELKKLRDDLAQLKKNPPEMPAAMGLTEAEAVDLPVHIRGNHLTLGEVVPRRFPAVLAGTTQPALGAKQSGRLQLARWLASPEHPLTSRVIVNRVWRWHFGQGIVRTPDNFGLLGDRPSHPELLDYLAATFSAPATPGEGSVDVRVCGCMGVEQSAPGVAPAKSAAGKVPSGLVKQATPAVRTTPTHPHIHTPTLGLGWSLKRLHRLLLLSNTYQQASTPSPSGGGQGTRNKELGTRHNADPENRFFGRADVRRLEVEEIRDALLSVSGLLDRTMGGKSLPLKNREYVFDHTSKDATKYDSRRRSLYLPVIRNNLYDVFQLFDFGDAATTEGSRPTTTVAPQALFMMNSDLVMDAAEALAAQALARADLDTAGRLDFLYRQAYGRPVTREEVARGEALLARFAREAAGEAAEKRETRAWGWLCHVLLATNEFVYVR